MLWTPILRHLLNLTQDLSRIHGMWINRCLKSGDVHPMPNMIGASKTNFTVSHHSALLHLCDKSFDAPTARRNKCLSLTSPWNQITFPFQPAKKNSTNFGTCFKLITSVFAGKGQASGCPFWQPGGVAVTISGAGNLRLSVILRTDKFSFRNANDKVIKGLVGMEMEPNHFYWELSFQNTFLGVLSFLPPVHVRPAMLRVVGTPMAEKA